MPHYARWGPNSLPQKGAEFLQFLAYVYCGQTAAWIKMPLGKEVDLGPHDIVLDGYPAFPSQKGGGAPPKFRPMSIVAKRLDRSGWHLAWRLASAEGTLCSIETQPPPQKRQSPHFLAHVYCGQTAALIKVPLGTEVGLSADDIVTAGHPLPKRGQPPNFRPVYCGQTAGRITMPLVMEVGLCPGHILHRFRDIAVDRSEIAIFYYPSCV